MQRIPWLEDGRIPATRSALPATTHAFAVFAAAESVERTIAVQPSPELLRPLDE